MKNKKGFETLNVITVALSHLVHDTFSSFLAPMLPLLIKNLGLSMFQAGFLDFVRKIPSLFNPFLGLLADRFSVKYFLIIAPAITSITMSLLGLTDSFWVLVLLVFVAGLSSSIFHVPAPVIVKKFSGNKLGMGLSWYQVGGELARTIGPLIIIGAISLWGLKGTWRLMIFGLLASGFLFVKIRNTKIETNAKKDNKKVKHTLKKYTPLFISITGIVLFRSAMKAALSTFLPVYITSKGQSLWFSGISLSVFQFAGTFGTLFLGSISDKISRKTILIFISAINPILMFLFIVSKGIFLFPILLITGFVLLGSTPIILAMVQEFGSDNLAFVNGIYMTIGFVTSSIMVLFIGFLSDKIGIFLTYRITALLALGAIPFAILLPKTSKKENER